MKVGQQPADHFEFEPWIDEQLRRSSAGDDSAVLLAGDGFQRPRRGCPDGNYPARLIERLIDRVGTVIGNLIALSFHAVLFNTFDTDRLKRPIADMQRDFRDLDASLAQG